jgi:hypothetical protein
MAINIKVMLNRPTLMQEIKDITSVDNFRLLQKFLDLAILVDKNYEHIQQLETLRILFDGGMSAYYKEYYPNDNRLTELMGIVVDNTRANHYKKDGEKLYPSVYDVQMEIIGEESDMPNYKAMSFGYM